jgi:hypothetical protein
VVAIFVITLVFGVYPSGVIKAESERNGKRGIATDAIPCLAVGPGSSNPAAGEIKLKWQGRAEQARLIITVAGAEAAHTIKVNGQAVATAPLHPEGQQCGEGEVYYLALPPDVVKHGLNTVELTNDAQPGDRWHASDVRLEVLGKIKHDKETAAEEGVQAAAGSATIATIPYLNSYDNTNQEARFQIPAMYNSATPTPLVLVIHPRSTDMFWGENDGFHTAADSRGWFYGSPQLHGNWPGTAAFPIPNPPGKYVYASLQSQYDIVGLIQYAITNYNIDPNRIYLYGSSMGAQTGATTVGKFPDLFAAAFFNKGPSDWVKWHQQTQTLIAQGYAQSFHRGWMERECYLLINGVPTARKPSQNPFCYERRSGLNFARNYRQVPIALTHSQSDLLVPVSHSLELRDAVNSFAPLQAAGLTIDTVVGPTCTDRGGSDPTPYYHCFENDPNSVFNFLAPLSRAGSPTQLRVATDQSKSFYWLKVTQTGDEHWSYVDVFTDSANQTVRTTVTDPNPLTLGFNLGAAPMTEILPQPGIGFAATTYLVKVQGQPAYVATYSGGYLNTPLSATGQYSLTISALEVAVSASPATRPAGTPVVSAITVLVRDKLGQPAPDQTPVFLTTTAGTFPNSAATVTATTSNGQATVNLSLSATDGVAQVTAAVGNAAAETTVGVTNGSSSALYLSSTTGGNVGGVAFANEDIIVHNRSNGAWSLFFDGSDVGLSAANLDAFSLQTDGSLLLSLAQPFTVTGLGLVDDSDLIRFVPTSTGPRTAGSFAWYFDGSAVGLETNAEDVDAFALLADGRLLFSTLGAVNVPGVTGADEDLLLFTPAQVGANTSGSWSLYFDGSDVALTNSSEDLVGAWIDPANNEIYLSTQGAYAVPGLSGDANDVLICTPASLGATTSCTYRLFWDGAANGFAGEVIDALDLAPPPVVVSASEPDTDPVDLPDLDDGTVEEAEERLFLPLINR